MSWFFIKFGKCEKCENLKSGKMKNADYIHKNGFFVGNDHRDLSNQLKLLKETIEDFARK